MCMLASLNEGMKACMHECMYVCVCMCVRACTHARMHVWVYIYTHIHPVHTYLPLMSQVLVAQSNRIGRSVVLRICLAGAAASSLLIAVSGSVVGVIAGRTLAGVFAACVPVAQSGVTDILPANQTALGLSRVSAASQLGVVVGPAASALLQDRFAALGLDPALCLPAVFVAAAFFSLSVLGQMASFDRRRPPPSAQQADCLGQSEQPAVPQTKVKEKPAHEGSALMARMAHPMLRTVTMAMGWTAILSNSMELQLQ